MERGKPTCEDCKHFHCCGYKYYECDIDDASKGPFDTPCAEFSEH